MKECEDYGNMYYVHSKSINRFIQNLLEKNKLFVYNNLENDYTYVCQQTNKYTALEQMKLT